MVKDLERKSGIYWYLLRHKAYLFENNFAECLSVLIFAIRSLVRRLSQNQSLIERATVMTVKANLVNILSGFSSSSCIAMHSLTLGALLLCLSGDAMMSCLVERSSSFVLCCFFNLYQ